MREGFVLFALGALVSAVAVVGATAAGEHLAPSSRAFVSAPSASGNLEDLAASDEPRAEVLVPRWPDSIEWIAVGGGSEPELNQISLEDDLLLVREVLGPERGIVLFAGGPGTRAVQVEGSETEGDPLRAALADLFSTRGARDARYQPARLVPHGPATLQATLEALRTALRQPGDPLVLWVASHGQRGDVPADAEALLWAGGALGPRLVADELASIEARRPLRLVVTSCYAGGFAELAFADLDPERGPSASEVCGLFATSWDEEASGCDPSPDRAASEAYAVHLLQALRGRDRQGRPALDEIDLDGDGRVDWLEAHARARIAALSFDLPTSTSSRLLRALLPRLAGPVEGASPPVELRDEAAVVRAIGERLRIEGEGDVQARLDALAARRVELEAAIEARQAEAEELWWTLAGRMLSRWPVIDDPWHPDFEPTLAREGEAIRAFLEGSAEYAAWLRVQDDLDAMEHTRAALAVEAAPLRRWLEAHETLALAARLRAVGGDAWERYQRMRACEAGRP